MAYYESSPEDTIRLLRARIAKLEALNAKLEARCTEYVNQLASSVQTKDRMMFDLILCGALSMPRAEPLPTDVTQESLDSGNTSQGPQG